MARFFLEKRLENYSKPSSQQGFTLIELVMVIILIGVLSVGASSLFSSKDAYVDYIAKERLLSFGLLAQQIALGMSAQEVAAPGSALPPAGNPSDIQFTRTVGGELTFTLRKHQQTVQSYELQAPLPAIAVDGITLAAGSTATLSWDRFADMVDGNNHNVTISSGSTYRICFSSSGYVYETAGACP